MAGGSSPIAIAIRHNSASPQQQTSNLTYALNSTSGNELRPTSAMNVVGNMGKSSGTGRHDSISMSGLTPQYGSGAVPISVNGSDRNMPRRGSMASSMAGGMSWGGVSMSSWVRDDIVMQGTSPLNGGVQSPSYHSSSYLPKFEANFMKDFNCCGSTLASLHDLVQHYEEEHAQRMPQAAAGPYISSPPNTNSATGTAEQRDQDVQNPSNTRTIPHGLPAGPFPKTGTSITQPPAQGGLHRNAVQSMRPIQDMEAVEDMELDDVNDENQGVDFASQVNQSVLPLPDRQQFARQPQFGQHAPSRVPPLDMNAINVCNNMSFQGLRQSQPSTPVPGGRPGAAIYHNPTVSSVNTPTLSAHPLHQQQFKGTPDSSAPGTPAELDSDLVGNLGSMSMDPQLDFATLRYGSGNDLGAVYIDDPAKRLFSPSGGTMGRDAHSKLGTAQYGPNSDLAKTIREQQRKAGLADTVEGITHGEEPKPYRCPVIGCEKAYKNQNGLKYHKNHGHNTQQLHENPDGTFSIVDPQSLQPYPGTMGMEKEKPYKCDSCGKRYKNLNGLKYHKSHSEKCNTDSPVNTHSQNANVAGAGLSTT